MTVLGAPSVHTLMRAQRNAITRTCMQSFWTGPESQRSQNKPTVEKESASAAEAPRALFSWRLRCQRSRITLNGKTFERITFERKAFERETFERQTFEPEICERGIFERGTFGRKHPRMPDLQTGTCLCMARKPSERKHFQTENL